MIEQNKINEEISEYKNIPSGKDFSNLLSIYKVVQNGDTYINGYDRKFSAGWNGQGADCYGILGYTHLHLSGAMSMIGFSYGYDIVKIKLLGGLKNYIFFDTDIPEIRNLQVQAYGRPMNVYEQLLTLTKDQNIASTYGRYGATSFGQTAQHEIRRAGYYLRGMVCDYGYHGNDIVVYPFKFSDMVVCAVAKNLNRHMSEEEIESRFVGVMDQSSRDIQNGAIDIVPHLEVVNARDPDGSHFSRVNGKIYTPYETMSREYNILIIDEENWVEPKDKKLFPDTVRLDAMPSQVSFRGNFSFSMNKMLYQGNVIGNADGEQLTADNSPIFTPNGSGQWFAWENLQWMYENPDWVKSELLGNLNESVEEAFRQGMSFDEFKDNNRAIMYVCTHCYFLEGIMQHGFSREYANENDKNDNGGSLTYGDGVYGTPSLDNAANNLSRKTAPKYEKPDGFKYGDVILKCVLLGGWNGFLIFDETWAKKIYKDKWQIFDQIDMIVKDRTANQELKNYVRNYTHLSLYDPGKDSLSRTNHVIFNMFSNTSGFIKWTDFFRKNGIRGAIYHGHGDRFCCVCYDYSEVIPIEISYDRGQTWTTKGMTRTLDNGQVCTSNGIDWEKTHERLSFNGDPQNKLGGKYKNVSSFPKKISVNGTIFGIVNVEKHNGKFNCVRMDTLKEMFPIDFDVEPTVSMRGVVTFKYRGYNFEGHIFNEEAGGPSFFFNGSEFSINDIDAVIDYYIEGNGEYEEVNDETKTEEIQENFFKFLDKLENL